MTAGAVLSWLHSELSPSFPCAFRAKLPCKRHYNVHLDSLSMHNLILAAFAIALRYAPKAVSKQRVSGVNCLRGSSKLTVPDLLSSSSMRLKAICQLLPHQEHFNVHTDTSSIYLTLRYLLHTTYIYITYIYIYITYVSPAYIYILESPRYTCDAGALRARLERCLEGPDLRFLRLQKLFGEDLQCLRTRRGHEEDSFWQASIHRLP